jgi:hypothetical protein
MEKLAQLFLDFAVYTQHAIRRSLGRGNDGMGQSSDSDSPLQDLDLLLPKVYEALILTVQCLITIVLREEKAGLEQFRKAKYMINAAYQDQQGSIEILIGAPYSHFSPSFSASSADGLDCALHGYSMFLCFTRDTPPSRPVPPAHRIWQADIRCRATAPRGRLFAPGNRRSYGFRVREARPCPPPRYPVPR